MMLQSTCKNPHKTIIMKTEQSLGKNERGGPFGVDAVEKVTEAIKRIENDPALRAMLSSALTNTSKPFDEAETLAFFKKNLDGNINAYCQQFKIQQAEGC